MMKLKGMAKFNDEINEKLNRIEAKAVKNNKKVKMTSDESEALRKRLFGL